MAPADAAARTGRAAPCCAARLPTARTSPAAGRGPYSPWHTATQRVHLCRRIRGVPWGATGPRWTARPAELCPVARRPPLESSAPPRCRRLFPRYRQPLIQPTYAASPCRCKPPRPLETATHPRAAMAHTRPARDTETHQTHDQAVCSGVLVVDGSKSGARARGFRDRAPIATARERGAKPRPPAPRAEGGAQRCRGNPAALCVAPGRAAGGPPRAADQRR